MTPPGERAATPAPDPAAIRKRSVVLDGHATSVSLEDAFWAALRRIAAARGQPVAALIAEVDRSRRGNLSSALRVFVLETVERP